MKTNIIRSLGTFLLTTIVFLNSYSQIPLVYSLENTGADCTPPVLLDVADLADFPVVEPLTDPLEWSDGSGRLVDFADWACRRAEIKAEFEQYEIGEKPDRPENITATYADGLLTVIIVVNDETLTLTSNITLPEGEGPFPAVLGMGFGGTGSLPAEIFTSRDIAQIPFNYGQVMAHTQTRGSEPINKLYPDLTYMGAYSAWSWGVSRLIDGLELVADDLPIDIEHLAVTGCSFAGKMALWAGAFDERIALTIVQESGGGGAAAWRVSETLGVVEKLGATNFTWFIKDMAKFAGGNTAKLPMDHHELLAMIFPRAVLNIGNPSQVWLAEEAGYVSSVAAHEVWKNFGVGDRFGYTFNADHGHCALPAIQVPDVEAFVDKFLLDSVNVNTDITVHEYDNVDHERWFNWWGSEEPVFPFRDYGDFYEAECATLGSNWAVAKKGFASPVYYATAKDELESIDEAPTSPEDHLTITFNVEEEKAYKIFGRLLCSAGDANAFWIKMDDGAFEKYDGLTTSGWEWKLFDSFDLTAGEHTITIAYCENGASLDRICIFDSPYEIIGLGSEALNACVVGIEQDRESSQSHLSQNFPNPFNDKTTISFEFPIETYVSLKVHSILGEEIAELAGKEYSPGKHTVEFVAGNLPMGIYFYTISADKYSACRKMLIQSP